MTSQRWSTNTLEAGRDAVMKEQNAAFEEEARLEKEIQDRQLLFQGFLRFCRALATSNTALLQELEASLDKSRVGVESVRFLVVALHVSYSSVTLAKATEDLDETQPADLLSPRDAAGGPEDCDQLARD